MDAYLNLLFIELIMTMYDLLDVKEKKTMVITKITLFTITVVP